MSIAVRSSVPVKWPKEVEHVWFKGTNEEPSASFSWEPAVLTSSSLPAASSAELPTKDSEPQSWFRRFPGTAKWGGAQTRLGPKSNMQPEQSKMSLSVLCSWHLSTVCAETGMLRNTESTLQKWKIYSVCCVSKSQTLLQNLLMNCELPYI